MSRYLIRLAALLFSSVVLVACGGQGSNDVLPDYILEYSTVLDESTIGPQTLVRPYYLSELTATGSISEWYDAGNPITADRVAAGSVDARQIPFELTPAQFIDYWVGDGAVDVSVSNPNAKLRVLSGIQIQQVSAYDGSALNSHLLYHLHPFTSQGTEISSINMRSVFTDVPVTISARYVYPDGYVIHTDLELVAGWNILFVEWTEDSDHWQASPWYSSLELIVSAQNRWVAGSVLDQATRGWAMYPAHLSQSASSNVAPLYWGNYRLGSGIFNMYLPSWIHPENPVLVGLTDAIPVDTIIARQDPPESLRVVMASAHGFDDLSSAGWQQQPAASDSRISFQDEVGNNLMWLYSNQRTVLHLELIDDGHTVRTPEPNGIRIFHGWNALVLEREPDSNSSVLSRFTGSIPGINTVVSRTGLTALFD